MIKVRFLDYDKKVLSEQEIESGKDATPPADPVREGYTFTGWDKAYTALKQDTDITALYSQNYYSVTFLSDTGALLKRQTVVHGGDATAPKPPAKTGFTFFGWSRSFTYVTSDLATMAMYRENNTNSRVEIYNGTSKVGEIKKVLSCNVIQKVSGECTLELTTMMEFADFIQSRFQAEVDGLVFDIVKVQKNIQSGLYMTSISCEHVSYVLNDDEYKITEFMYSGSPELALKKLLQGTPFNVGTVEYTDNITVRINQECTRRQALMQLIAICGGEIKYDGYKIGIVKHNGSTDRRNLMGTRNVTNIGYSYDTREGATTYSVELARRSELQVGDEIYLKFTPLSIDVESRIVGITWDPYNWKSVQITVGSYAPTLNDTLYKIEEKAEEGGHDYSGEITDIYENIDELWAEIEGGGGGGWDIQSVDELPSNPQPNVLYLIRLHM